TERLFIEIIKGSSLFLGVIADVPRLEGLRVGALELALESAELLGLVRAGGWRPLCEIFDELLGLSAGLGHSILCDEIGEAREAEQVRLLSSQPQDIGDELQVVACGNAASIERSPDLFAQRPILGEGQNGDHGRRLEGETISLLTFRFS